MDKEVVYVYNGILFGHKKNEILPFAITWIELENIRLSEVSQRIPYDFTHMWNLRNKTNEQRKKRDKPKNRLKYREQTNGY